MCGRQLIMSGRRAAALFAATSDSCLFVSGILRSQTGSPVTSYERFVDADVPEEVNEFAPLEEALLSAGTTAHVQLPVSTSVIIGAEQARAAMHATTSQEDVDTEQVSDLFRGLRLRPSTSQEVREDNSSTSAARALGGTKSNTGSSESCRSAAASTPSAAAHNSKKLACRNSSDSLASVSTATPMHSVGSWATIIADAETAANANRSPFFLTSPSVSCSSQDLPPVSAIGGEQGVDTTQSHQVQARSSRYARTSQHSRVTTGHADDDVDTERNKHKPEDDELHFEQAMDDLVFRFRESVDVGSCEQGRVEDFSDLRSTSSRVASGTSSGSSGMNYCNSSSTPTAEGLLSSSPLQPLSPEEEEKVIAAAKQLRGCSDTLKEALLNTSAEGDGESFFARGSSSGTTKSSGLHHFYPPESATAAAAECVERAISEVVAVVEPFVPDDAAPPGRAAERASALQVDVNEQETRSSGSALHDHVVDDSEEQELVRRQKRALVLMIALLQGLLPLGDNTINMLFMPAIAERMSLPSSVETSTDLLVGWKNSVAGALGVVGGLAYNRLVEKLDAKKQFRMLRRLAATVGVSGILFSIALRHLEREMHLLASHDTAGKATPEGTTTGDAAAELYQSKLLFFYWANAWIWDGMQGFFTPLLAHVVKELYEKNEPASGSGGAGGHRQLPPESSPTLSRNHREQEQGGTSATRSTNATASTQQEVAQDQATALARMVQAIFAVPGLGMYIAASREDPAAWTQNLVAAQAAVAGVGLMLAGGPPQKLRGEGANACRRWESLFSGGRRAASEDSQQAVTQPCRSTGVGGAAASGTSSSSRSEPRTSTPELDACDENASFVHDRATNAGRINGTTTTSAAFSQNDFESQRLLVAQWMTCQLGTSAHKFLSPVASRKLCAPLLPPIVSDLVITLGTLAGAVLASTTIQPWLFKKIRARVETAIASEHERLRSGVSSCSSGTGRANAVFCSTGGTGDDEQPVDNFERTGDHATRENDVACRKRRQLEAVAFRALPQLLIFVSTNLFFFTVPRLGGEQSGSAPPTAVNSRPDSKAGLLKNGGKRTTATGTIRPRASSTSKAQNRPRGFLSQEKMMNTSRGQQMSSTNNKSKLSPKMFLSRAARRRLQVKKNTKQVDHLGGLKVVLEDLLKPFAELGDIVPKAAQSVAPVLSGVVALTLLIVMQTAVGIFLALASSSTQQKIRYLSHFSTGDCVCNYVLGPFLTSQVISALTANQDALHLSGEDASTQVTVQICSLFYLAAASLNFAYDRLAGDPTTGTTAEGGAAENQQDHVPTPSASTCAGTSKMAATSSSSANSVDPSPRSASGAGSSSGDSTVAAAPTRTGAPAFTPAPLEPAARPASRN
ncbi:unnamed protein product [Amoebophrya sp. A120]|nr:unnamed protein product [Amoebophrya sp. A120]|eukprot:GSA120T00001340001.1